MSQTDESQDVVADDTQFTASTANSPLVENGFEVVGPTSRKPSEPAPGQRYLDTDLNTYSIYNGTSWLSVNTSAGVGVLDDVGDVNATDPDPGDFLGWNGSSWSNVAISLDSLSDVAITTPTAKQTLRYNGSSWVNSQLAITDLLDVAVDSPSDNQFLRWDAGSSKFVNETVSVPSNQGGFNVLDYGAVGDGVTDDTLAFQACIAAAEAYALAHGYAAMFIPRSLIYLVGDPSIAAVDSLHIPSAPLHFSTTARNIDVIGYGALLKLSDNGVSNSVVRIFGSNIRVLGLTINVACDPATLALKGCTAFEVNGSLDEGVQGVDVQFIDCRAIGGFFDMDDPNQGHEHFLAVGATRPKWDNCFSQDCGWTSFRSAASDDIWINCTAIDFRGNGFRLNEGTTARLAQCTVRSSRCRGRSGFLADAGSTATYPAKRRTRVFMTDCVGYASPTAAGSDPGCALVKLAAADFVHINGGEFEVETGNTSSINYALRLEDNLRKVVIENVQVKGGVIFTPDQFHGVPTAQASAWLPDGTSPYVQWTLPASHPIRTGDTIFIQDSAIAAYNRPHVITSDSSGSKAITSITNSGGHTLLTVAAGHNVVAGHTLTVTGSGVGAYNTTHTVTSVTATTILTNRTYTADSTSSGMAFTNSANPVLITSDVPYAPGSLGANIYVHEGVDELHIKHATIENDWTDTGSDQVDIIQEGHCRILNVEETVMRFNGVRTEKLRGIGWYMPDAGLDLMRFKNVQIIGDTNKVFSGVKPLEARGTDEVQRVTVINNGGTPGGSFTLSLSGYGTTGAINWNSVAATVASNMQTALRAVTGLSAVGVQFISGDFTAGAIFEVTFLGTAGNLSQLVALDSMTGSVHSLAVATTVEGVISSQLTKSGKTIGINFTIVNKGTGETYLISPYQATDNGAPYADRLTLFNSTADVVGRYAAAAMPSSIAVGWNQGDRIDNSAPASGDRPGWRCIATTAAGSAPSFQREAALS